MSQEVKASEGLFFYRERAFKRVLFILLGALGFLLLVGVAWELLINRPRRRKCLNGAEINCSFRDWVKLGVAKRHGAVLEDAVSKMAELKAIFQVLSCLNQQNFVLWLY